MRTAPTKTLIVATTMLPKLLSDAAIVSDGALLFSPARQEFLALNESATAMAILSDEGLGADGILQELGSISRLAPGQSVTRSDIESALLRIWKHGRTAISGTRCYRMGSTSFRIHFDAVDDEEMLLGILRHVQTETAGPRARLIEVVTSGKWTLVRSDVESCAVRNSQKLPAILISMMLRMAYRSPGTLAAFHAGAVARNGRGIIVAGASGSGKTTLTAALTARGFSFLSDEAAILRNDLHIDPAPAPLGLTTQALPLIEAFIPGCTELHAHRRRDGSSVHYWSPSDVGRERVPAQTLVFPHIAPAGSSEIVPLGPRAAFERLHQAGYDIPNELTLEQGQRFIDWLQQTDRFELRIGSLAEAVDLLHGRVAIGVQ